ncbi:MAG: serine hydrolase [Gammaproteobacteria bacterium]|nr:serine hydrolase [Gammaproteobacteria bacterium]
MTLFAATHLPRLALAIALSFPALAGAQSSAELHSQLQDRAKSFFSGAEPGGVVLVRKGDQILLRAGFGLADVENKVPMTADKVLPLASVTKQFTAFAVLQLVQAGKLQLDQPVGDVLTHLPPALAKVSLRQLLTHTSGVKNISRIAESRAARRNEASVDELIAYFKDLPLEFEPGSRFEYSNSNYILLTRVIEMASGSAYADYMHKAVFAPLSMSATRFGSHTELVPGRAHGYRLVKGKLQNADFISMTQPQGAGALISSVDDLDRWHAALSEGRLVDRALMAQAFSKVTLKDGSRMPYGFGWAVSQVQGEGSNEHSGFINGFSTYTLRVPEKNIYVSVLTNSEQFWPDDFAVELAAIALGRPFDRKPAKNADRSAWLGSYKFDKSDVRELKLDAGNLVLLQQGDKPVPVIAGADGRYYLGESLDHLSFARSSDGKRTMTVHSRLMGDSTGTE